MNEKSLREIMIQQYMLHEFSHHGDVVTTNTEEAVEREPVAHTMRDIYKCLHQAEFGVGHIVDDTALFHDRLLREILRAEPPVDEPLLEAISLDGSTFRLNLRPYRMLFSGDEIKAAEILSEVCFESARVQKGKGDRFLNLLMAFRDLNDQGGIQVGQIRFAFPSKETQRFISEALALGRRMGTIPVFSHSSAYNRLNKPSYRVVYLDALENSRLGFILED